MDTFDSVPEEEVLAAQEAVDTEEETAPEEGVSQEGQEPLLSAEEALPAEEIAETAEEIPAEEAVTEEAAAEETAEPETPVQEEAAAETAPARPVSPFADGPYVVAAEPVSRKAKKARKVRVKKEKTPRCGFWKKALCAVLVLALTAGACAVTAHVVQQRWQQELAALKEDYDHKLDTLLEDAAGNAGGSVQEQSPVPSLSGTKTPAEVYAENVDAVVMIYSQIRYEEYGQVTTGVSTGSGFVLTSDGHVVTNYHVVAGATSVSVSASDGMEYEATLVGYDSTNDVALLKVDGYDMPHVTVGSSSDLIVGDQVVAVGNPLGELTSTLTVGYISAKERDVNTDGTVINMLQTDAAINAGNSGGPLFNMNGDVIGITTAKYSGTTESGASIEGIGFAIPIDDVYDLLSDLINYGYVNSAYLGVSVSDVDPDAAAYFGMPVGAMVQEVVEGNCAAAAGVQVKDIIVSLGGIEVGSVSDLTRALRQFEPGETVIIVVSRGGQLVSLEITLDAKPQTAAPSMPDGDFDAWYDYFFGNGG